MSDPYNHRTSRRAYWERPRFGNVFVTAIVEDQPKSPERARVHALDHGEYVWEDVAALHRRAGDDEQHRRHEEAKYPEQRDREFKDLIERMRPKTEAIS